MDKDIENVRQEVIRTHAKIWSVKLKIYSVENTRLIVPIALVDALYFIFWEVTAILINIVLPIFSSLPFIVKFVVFPYAMMKFISLVKLEGKQPHMFFWDLIVFLLLPKKYENFRPSQYLKSISFKSKIYFVKGKKSNV